jgi:hypothetical protein
VGVGVERIVYIYIYMWENVNIMEDFKLQILAYICTLCVRCITVDVGSGNGRTKVASLIS